MKKFVKVLAALALLIAIGVFVFFRVMLPAPPSSQAFINGLVLTMDQDNTTHEAVLVEGDRIVKVGPTDDILAAAQNGTGVIDLQGRTLMPGIIDAHGHFPGTGIKVVAVDLSSPPVGDVKSIEQSIDLLKAKVQDVPEGRWVIGFGYDDTAIADKRHFTRADLDLVSSEHPVYAVHSSSHMGVGNSVALSLLGIDETTPDPVGGTIVKDENGVPTGLLLEAAHSQASEVLYAFSLPQQYKIGDNATKHYLSRGVTTAQNGLANQGVLDGLSLFSRLGLAPMRLIVWPDEALAAKILAGELDTSRYDSDKFSVGAFKLSFDGSIQGYTGYLKDAYFQLPERQEAGYRGHLRGPRHGFFETVLNYHKSGHQIAIHANGDAAIDVAIDAFANAQKEHFVEDARPIVVHSQMARGDQLARMNELGMTPSFFTAHTYFWGDRHKSIFLGEERASAISPMRSAADAGLTFTIHLDSPVVPMEPMMMIWNATQRTTSSGDVLGEEERVSAIDALRATTIDAAWQVRMEDRIGSIEPGKFADLIILSENPLESGNIRDIQVLQTIVGGVTVFQTDDM